MGETLNPAWQCTIHLTSQDDASADEAWQDTCRQLYQRFTTIIRDEQGEIHPLQQPAPAEAKAHILELFHQIVAYGLSIGAFTGIYNLAKLWLEQRPRCEIELAFPDGSKLKMRGLSWAEQSGSSRSTRPEAQKMPLKIVLP